MGGLQGVVQNKTGVGPRWGHKQKGNGRVNSESFPSSVSLRLHAGD